MAKLTIRWDRSTIGKPQDQRRTIRALGNREEFESGTIPTDPNSFLKVDSIAQDTEGSGGFLLTFMAVTNRTYTVQFKQSLSAVQWNNLTDVTATPSNRVVEVIDIPSAGVQQRYYRLVTPKQ